MSHISAFEEEERIAEAQENTPKAILKNPLHHFYHKSTVKKVGKKCVQHDKKYARRISFQPDVVAGIEEEDFLPGIRLEYFIDTYLSTITKIPFQTSWRKFAILGTFTK